MSGPSPDPVAALLRPPPGWPAQEHRQLLVRLLRERLPAAPTSPATVAQRQLWFLQQLEPTSTAYHILTVVRMTGELDLPALRGALAAVTDRHDLLRATFAMVDDEVVVRIGPCAPVPVPVVDLGTTDAVTREERVRQELKKAHDELFDLADGPLLRAVLIRCGASEHLLAVTVHHIVFDGWSRSVFWDHLTTAYDSLRAGKTPDLDPPASDDDPDEADDVVDEADPDAALAYWRERLAGLPDLDLPGVRDRVSGTLTAGRRLDVPLDRDVMTALTRLGRSRRATPFMTLLAAYLVLLSVRTGSSDVAVLSPTTGRTSEADESRIGYFVNTVVLRGDLAGNPNFAEVVDRVRELTLGAYAHMGVPFERIVDELRPARVPGRMPFSQFAFSVEGRPAPPPRLAGLTTAWIDVDTGTAKFDVQLDVMTDDSGGLVAAWTWRDELFDPADLAAVADDFAALLGAVVADPQATVDTLPVRGPLPAPGVPAATPPPAARARPGATASGTLVHLGGPTDRPPLVLPHPVSGTVGAYAELARLLPGHHLVGIESAADASGDSVDALAESYLAELVARWPAGPYRLCGWSMGGLLAYEMSRRLVRAGRGVDLLVVVDTAPGQTRSADDGTDDAAMAARFAADLAASLGREHPAPTAATLAALPVEEQTMLLRRWLVDAGVTPVALPVREVRRRVETFARHVTAVAGYRPEGAELPVTVVQASASPRWQPRWERYVGARTTVHEYEGDHYSLLRRPTVERIAGWLARALDAR
ncbi:condensation domain-containing protein [Micromonospora sp. NPDC023633]|uniref:condensation domain-containing protein n=1 Tax=Micromonospora sp. NPDC023633 TaxID=3154320 RepID=UPI00340CEDFD